MILSVRLMTYNHSNQIIECLKGVEMQETSFPFEVIIGDDFSTDNNVELIKNFILQSTNKKISYHLLDRKKGDVYDIERQKRGRLYNFINILDNCKGKYVALLDGDDYWVDPLKLQKQVAILEAHTNVSLVYSNAIINSEEGGDYTAYETFYGKDYLTEPIKDQSFFLKNNYGLIVVSIMYRNKYFNAVDKEVIQKFSTGDMAMYFILSGKGDFYYLNECSSVYYDHALGISKKYSKLKRDLFNYKKMELLLPYIKPENRTNFNYFCHRYLIRPVFNQMFKKSKDSGLVDVKLSEILFVKTKHLQLRYFYYYLKLIYFKYFKSK